MWVCFLEVLRTNLRVIGALTDENENSWSAVGTWVVSRLGFSLHPRDDDDEDDPKDKELGSMKGNKNNHSM